MEREMMLELEKRREQALERERQREVGFVIIDVQ
jgi:hypothetical protein